jgi:YggT family protein
MLNIVFFAVIIAALLSWFHMKRYNPAVSLVYSLAEPILRWCRKWVPAVGGIDLSPLIAIIGLQLIRMLVLPPLDQLVRVLT